MNELKINKILSDTREVEKLLLLEKKRRGVSKNKLVFIGMADVADYYWCAMRSLLKNKEMELDYFSAYLHDRILYSLELGYVKQLPKKKEDLLRIGDDITYNDIEKLLKEKAENQESKNIHVCLASCIVTDKEGNEVMVINPDLPQEERMYYEAQAKSEGIRVASPEEFPHIRGRFLGTTRAEQYPTIRWNFEWDEYVIIGVPDGITDNFVYEFKTTGSRFLMYYVKPVAFAQADLYGYFFRRDTKRVQIYIVEEGVTKTWEVGVDINNALEILEEFKAIDEGAKPIPPKKWKCKTCEFKERCGLWRETCLKSPPSSDYGR